MAICSIPSPWYIPLTIWTKTNTENKQIKQAVTTYESQLHKNICYWAKPTLHIPLQRCPSPICNLNTHHAHFNIIISKSPRCMWMWLHQEFLSLHLKNNIHTEWINNQHHLKLLRAKIHRKLLIWLLKMSRLSKYMSLSMYAWPGAWWTNCTCSF